MTNAVRLAEIENGIPSYLWDFTLTPENFFYTYFAKNIIYSNVKFSDSNNSFYVFLNDGTFFYISKGSCYDFLFDINGDKKPGVAGRDQFRFILCPENNKSKLKGFVPYNLYQKPNATRDELLKYCKEGGASLGSCIGIVQKDGWEFKDDYPYKL